MLVDADALTSNDLKFIGNGPEWLLSGGADKITYTKFVPGQPHSPQTARLAVAEQDPKTAKWSVRLLDDLPRMRPYASEDPDDPAPRISYIDPDGTPYWREVNNASTERMVPGMAASRALAVRFVGGERSAVYFALINGELQAVRYWLDTHQLQQLTFDTGLSATSSPFIWRAPEFGNDEVLMATADDAKEVPVYRQLDKTRPEWRVIYRVRGPKAGTQLSSVEPFVFDNKSYLFMSGVVPPHDFASAVFVSNIDRSAPLFRQVTPDNPLRTRTDPEVSLPPPGRSSISIARTAATSAAAPATRGCTAATPG